MFSKIYLNKLSCIVMMILFSVVVSFPVLADVETGGGAEGDTYSYTQKQQASHCPESCFHIKRKSFAGEHPERTLPVKKLGSPVPLG